MTVHLLLPAAGVGRRFSQALPKQYTRLHDRTILEWTLDLWRQVPIDGRRLLVLGAGDTRGQTLAQRYPGVICAPGGAERADSVLAGLDALDADGNDWVMVHDIARPCTRVEDIEKLSVHCRRTGRGGLLATPLTDTIKRYHKGRVSTLNREELWSALTPQCFRYDLLRTALSEALAAGTPITDEASAMEAAGHPVELVEGAADNIKLTKADDLALVEYYLIQQGRLIP